MLRGLLGEFGIVIAQGIGSAVKFAKSVCHGDWPSIPEVAMDVLTNLCDQMVALHLRIISYDKREFAAWLELKPIRRSSGGNERLERISKIKDRYHRRLLVTGMTAD